MGRSLLLSWLATLILGALLSVPHVQAYVTPCPTGFVNMGDSLTDTGNALNAFPFVTDAEYSPYGQTFFGAPAKRFSNGRLVPDFFSLAFRKPLLDSYFSTTAFNYAYGVNFAAAGATASRISTAVIPFSLTFQVAQLIRFRNSLKDTLANPACGNIFPNLPSLDSTSGWLYTLEFGGNDVLDALTNGIKPEDVASQVIPAAIQNISAAIQNLHDNSARHFLIFGIPAQGCSTVVLTLFGTLGPTDSLGCITFWNQLVQGYNSALLGAIRELRGVLPDATIAYFDYYNANIEILQNPQTYGFDPSKIKTACCGAPGVGNLNYNPTVTCGHPDKGSNVCNNPDQFITWDGVHFTEQFYRTIATFALNGQYTDQGTNYTENCGLDFSKFASTVTYQEAYPWQCDNHSG